MMIQLKPADPDRSCHSRSPRFLGAIELSEDQEKANETSTRQRGVGAVRVMFARGVGVRGGLNDNVIQEACGHYCTTAQDLAG
jgi:hypothetical protein